ncbi:MULTISPECIES: AraC family transcriptional regulator [unclassified Paenibacillus]|uniref:AraC family transcriptional regulator n=1 Tax=unclassified Paenibacillus TaxID=185978 RepID=UPI00278478EA|nr:MULTISPECIES: AraC family transcriptional regulator [unclassified Paenibacillus]MDQ0897627.1 AraC-like DNA-binding protein [Paenibacillus sp. V4I7]MDQ0916367.1 AraC-like DNA-binding protein [Paenibacillus sp. V4I5]
MRIHYVLPEPMYKHYTVYPDMIGQYAEFPEHQEWRFKGQLQQSNLHIVLSGKGYVKANGKEICLEAGQGFYYGSGLEQEYRTDPNDPWQVFWVHIAGDGISRLLNGQGTSSVWLFTYSDVPKLNQLTGGLLELASPYDRNEVQLAVKLYELLAELALRTETPGTATMLDKRARMREVAEYTRTHCTKPLTLLQMAEQAGFSTYYFSRMFHEVMGRTPMEWLFECRLVEAKQLLMSTEWTIKQVAEHTGFSQSSYFIARFREHTGLTPQEYRRLYNS